MHNAHPTTVPRLEGYELLERIGAGAYGEVWSARAPGGRTKAIKCIYGRHDESRAADELKALERTKEVRHPFVLSIERIELAEGRLMVVSELADGSLRDRLRACKEEGLPGIPREELLGYLRDSADALDYLTDTHDLQHLDVKPENLLLLAGHVKVADFGLVKSVGDQTQSLVGGMTPAYAPPEVFQGRPGRHSDQYSMAVLYQELLTGFLPFDGATAAELTLQHLGGEPNLLLPEHDRFVVSRALSKDPRHRFSSSSEFVRALASDAGFLDAREQREPPARRATPTVAKPTGVADPQTATQAFAGDVESATRPCEPILLDAPPPPDATARRLPAPEFDAETFTPSPALFIGVGGTAAAVLRELRGKLSEHFQTTAPLPTMPMLLLDTDQRTLLAAGRGAGRGCGLAPAELVALPLKRPQEYREKSAWLLKWLSRRWLYNIPKSLGTNSLRPLGRLALVDHARRAFQRIRVAAGECRSPESLAAAEEACGAPFRCDALRVYVVASTSGGAGSGMSLDVAYAVRAILERLPPPHARLIGVLTHATAREHERAELARVNTHAWLTEYMHFCHPQSAYPGDEGCGLPAHAPGVRPFDATYFVPLGTRLDDTGWEAAAAQVADFLYLDAVTPAQTLWDACRDQPSPTDAPTTLRTFAVKREEAAPSGARRAAEQVVIQRLLRAWGDQDQPAPGAADADSTSHVVHGAGELVGRLKLDAPGVATLCRGLVEAHHRSQPPAAPTAETALERLEQLNAYFAAGVGAAAPPLLGGATPVALGGAPVAELAAPAAERLARDVSEWIAARLDCPGERLAGTARAVRWFQDHTPALLKEFHRFAAATHGKVGQLVGGASSDPAGDVDEARFVRLKLDLAALEAAAHVAASLRRELDELDQTLVALRQATAHLGREALGQEPVDEEAGASALAAAGQCAESLAKTLDARLESDWIQPRGGLLAVWRDASARAGLASALAHGASRLVRETLASPGASVLPENLDAWPSPELLELGGGLRRCLVAPGAAGTAVEGVDATISTPSGDAYLCTEAEGVSALHTALRIIGRRRDYADFAHRVRTRNDIDWRGLYPRRDDDAREETHAVVVDAVSGPPDNGPQEPAPSAP